ncbi:hypothetical protein P9112_012361 [Eukaryota sp. TZLM1-RC]
MYSKAPKTPRRVTRSMARDSAHNSPDINHSPTEPTLSQVPLSAETIDKHETSVYLQGSSLKQTLPLEISESDEEDLSCETRIAEPDPCPIFVASLQHRSFPFLIFCFSLVLFCLVSFSFCLLYNQWNTSSETSQFLLDNAAYLTSITDSIKSFVEVLIVDRNLINLIKNSSFYTPFFFGFWIFCSILIGFNWVKELEVHNRNKRTFVNIIVNYLFFTNHSISTMQIKKLLANSLCKADLVILDELWPKIESSVDSSDYVEVVNRSGDSGIVKHWTAKKRD